MNDTLYYTPPEDKIFNEMKGIAISIWSQYDDTYGYATGKINMIKNIGNISDNFMYIFAMFDPINQARVFIEASEELKREILMRLQ